MRSKNNFPKIKDRAFVINLDECANIGTHWVAISVKNDLAIYFGSFGIKYVPKELNSLLVIKLLVQMFIEYKHMIQ